MGATPDGPRSPFGIREIVRFRTDPLTFVSDNARRFGDVVSFSLGRQQAYQVNHPDLVRELLVTNAADHLRGPVMQRARAVMGTGLLTAEEPCHTEHRRTLQPLFHRDRLRSYADVIESVSRREVERWRDGATIDVRNSMRQFSLNVVGQALFGVGLEHEACRIAKAVTAFMLMMDAVFFPWPDQLLRLPLPSVRRFHRALADLDQIVGRMIEAPGEESIGIAAHLLREGAHCYSRREIRDECVTFLLAGHETVGNALTFALLLAAQHPDVAERAAEEADRCLGLPAAERFDRLPYTRALFAESIRLYPPVWILARQTRVPSRIGASEVPSGTIIFVSHWVVHRDSRFFEDAEQFVPERFMAAVPPRHAYFPFGAGPRQCIGEGFAWLEGTLALADILHRWRLRLMSDRKPALVAKVTLRPAKPVLVRVTTRSAAQR